LARPGRAYWKGHLRLSLVSIPVEIYNAVDSASDISFNQIHKPTGKRVNYQKIVKGVGPIENADIVKGYEIDKDQYVIIEPEELDAIKLESKKTIDLQEFVDLKEIDPRFFERPYYMVPGDDLAAEGYTVIRDALAKKGKAGVGQVTMSGREYLVAVSAIGKGLVMEILRYPNELRPAESYFNDLPTGKADAEMVSLAGELIDRKAAEFKPEKYTNTYALALKALVEKKAKGQKIVTAPESEPPRGNVINLMDALRKSVERGRGSSSTNAAKSAKKSGGKKRA
jgi:DNA end-binding protein Ku